MGLAEIGVILLSVAVPGIVLGVVAILRRRGRLKRLAIPPKLAPLAATLFMSVCSVLLLAILTIHAPRGAVGARPDRAASRTAVDPAFSRHRVYIFPLEDWGDAPKRGDLGARYSHILQDELCDRGLYAVKGTEHRVPLDIFQKRENTDPYIKSHYRKIVPFVCVWGSIVGTRDGELEATVHVNAVDRSITPSTLLERDLSFPASLTALDQSARSLAEEIAKVVTEHGEE